MREPSVLDAVSLMEALQRKWNELYREKLPSLAKEKDAAQDKWPVRLDHCFARIILDNAVGKDRPWMEVVKAPASKNMTETQIKAAIGLGEAICQGKENLVELDNRSLELRGKFKKGSMKRKNGVEADQDDSASSVSHSSESKRAKPNGAKDIRAAFSRVEREIDGETRSDVSLKKEQTAFNPVKNTSLDRFANLQKSIQPLTAEQKALYSRIRSDKSLSTFRKHILLLLTQVPPGRITTYGAIAKSYQQVFSEETNARAVGSAMRNNPFAPDVPCHRVIASDGKIGGFGGEWGEDKNLPKEKRRILREEGVRFGGDGKVAGQVFTAFHLPDDIQVSDL